MNYYEKIECNKECFYSNGERKDDELIGLNQWIKLKVVKSRSVMYDVEVMV